jgi:hypothetical protein
MKALSLFIKPPFTNLTLLHGFGDPVQTGNAQTHLDVRYRTNGPVVLYAACKGTLSLRRPYYVTKPSYAIDASQSLDESADTVDLFLELDPTAALNPVFWYQNAQGFDFIKGFCYRGVSKSSLVTQLDNLLLRAVLPRTLSKQNVVDLLLKNEATIPVTAGHPIGNPALADVQTIPFVNYEFSFGVENHDGPVDPAAYYDQMRDFVQDASGDLDDFLGLTPRNWPLIDPSLSVADAIAETASALFPYSALTKLKENKNLTRAQFRQIGDNQKELYRQQLSRRFAQLVANSSQPPFSFNDKDPNNVFQIEAVVEFFVNFNEPLTPNAEPRTRELPVLSGASATVSGASSTAGYWVTLSEPTVTSDNFAKIIANDHFIFLAESTTKPGRTFRIIEVNTANRSVRVYGNPTLANSPTGWSIDLYKKVDFLDPAGETPDSINGNTINLDGNPDLRNVRPDHDYIVLNFFGVETPQYLKITAINPSAHSIVTDGQANPNAVITDWAIRSSPHLVLIDPFGARPKLDSQYRSVDFRASKHPTSPTRVILGQPNSSNSYPNLDRVNIKKFDSIYFEADTARQSRTYRIVNLETQTVGSTVVRNVVELDGEPNFSLDTLSHWQIPAGIGGQLAIIGGLALGPDPVVPLADEYNTAYNKGYDQYDGMLFLVYGGDVNTSRHTEIVNPNKRKVDHPKIHAGWRWTSYTSRIHTGGTSPAEVRLKSSMRGNKEYDYQSIKADSAYKNFAFNVVDRYETYNGVSEARYYFENPVADDSVAPGHVPSDDGKTSCYFHRGDQIGDDTGSGGCLVSPLYFELLHTLAQIERDSRELLGDAIPGWLTLILDNSLYLLDPASQYSAITDIQWNNQLKGTVWLIRPEQFYVTYSRL